MTGDGNALLNCQPDALLRNLSDKAQALHCVAKGAADCQDVRERAVQPSATSDFGIVYGIQIGQAFGFQYGYGIISNVCSITFILV